MIYFISGHRDLSFGDFEKYYIPKLQDCDKEATFVVGDCSGVDTFAQKWLKENWDHAKVIVFHMFDRPRNLATSNFNLEGGYLTDIERDSAMTKISDQDIAFIGKGRWTSGTAQNLLRRFEIKIDEHSPN